MKILKFLRSKNLLKSLKAEELRTTEQQRHWIATSPITLAPRNDGNKLDGFTLVELVVTIAVVIILSVVSVPIYNANIDKAKISEGYALIGMIKSAQERYYSEYGNFLHSQHSSSEYWTTNEVVLGVDARNNKYYTNFFVGLGDQTVGFKAVAGRRANSGYAYVVLIYNLSLGNTIYTSTSW